MNRILERFTKTGSAVINRDTSIIIGGILLGRIIYILFTFMIAKIYSPSDFGILGVFLSLSAILSSMVVLGFDQALPIPKEPEEVGGIIILGIISTFIITAIIYVIFGTFSPFLGKISFYNKDLSKYIAVKSYIHLLLLNVIIMALFGIYNNIAIREKKFKIIGLVGIVVSLFMGLIQLISGLIGFNVRGLMIGVIAGRFIGILLMANLAFLYLNFKKVDVFILLKKYYKFPLIVSTSNLINSLGTNIVILMVNMIFGPQLTGFFLWHKG